QAVDREIVPGEEDLVAHRDRCEAADIARGPAGAGAHVAGRLHLVGIEDTVAVVVGAGLDGAAAVGAVVAWWLVDDTHQLAGRRTPVVVPPATPTRTHHQQ